MKGTYFCSLKIRFAYVLSLFFFACLAQDCDQGYYWEDSDCTKCDLSCKTCSDASSCDSCEDYMFLDTTTNLCIFCTYGEYYDFSAIACKQCNGSCYGNCKYQSECYECLAGEMLDTDTLTCVQTCASPKIELQDSQFTIPSICRGTQFYVDPSSSSILELGTRDHPYQTMKGLMSEILNHHSNQDRNLTIYLKEGEEIYMEDETGYIMNITSVTIASYSDNKTSTGRATVIPTEKTQSTDSKKAAFSILANTDLRLAQVISDGGYTSAEQAKLLVDKVTLLVFKSSIYIHNVDFKREYIDLGKSTYFIYLVYLQDRVCEIQNADFNITGIIAYATDPFNGNFENITVDFYMVSEGFRLQVDCNYPEASLQNEVVFSYLKYIKSHERTLPESAVSTGYMGPGNFSVINSDLRAFSSNAVSARPALLFISVATCQPDDDLIQYIVYDNLTTSLEDNPIADANGALILLSIESSIFRSIISHAYNLHFTNFENNFFPAFMKIGNAIDKTYFENITTSNYYGGSAAIIQAMVGNQMSFKNIYFEVGNEVSYPLMLLSYVFRSVTLENVTIANWTTPSSEDGRLITLSNIEYTYTLIKGITVLDSSLNHMNVIGSISLLQQLIIRDCSFRDLTIESSTSLVSTGEIKSIIFAGNTANGLRTSDDISTENSILYIGNLNLNSSLNSEISNNTVEDSHISFLSFGSFTKSSPTTKSILISNLDFTNTEFDQSRDLISTNGIETTEEISIVLSQISFSGIIFKSRGALINFQHHLTDPVTLIDSVFTNLTAARITIESANKQNTVQITKVEINSTSFDQISDEHNSLIIVRQGGWLEINNSNFSNIVSFEEGSVIKAGTKQTTTIIRDSLFVNNTALQGGVFSVEEESVIKIYDSNITHNFASVSGVIRVVTNGYFQLYNTNIYENYASQSPISELFDSKSVSIVSGCTIYDNEALTLQQITDEFNSCDKLCFVSQAFIDHTSPGMPETASELDFGETSRSLFQLISGTQNPGSSGNLDPESASLQSTLRIEDGTVIKSQSSLLYLFLASTSIKDSVISSLTLIEHPITIASSSLYLQNVTLSGIEATEDLYLIFTLQDSFLYMKDTILSGIKAGAFHSRNTEVTVDGLEVSNIIEDGPIVSLSTCNNVNLTGVSITESTSNNTGLIYIEESANVSIYDSYLAGINETAVLSLSSSLTLIQGLHIQQCAKAIYCEDSTITKINGITFDGNGGSEYRYGGSMEIYDSIVQIQNSSFINNVGMFGGAIHFGCTSTSQCNLTVQNSTFEANRGVEQGGAINYDYARPTFDNIVYINNTAPYGKNVASYPVKITKVGSIDDKIYLSNVGSGILSTEVLELGLYDYDDQIMILENERPIVIKAVDSNSSSILGINSVLLQQGVATFDSLYFYATPGETNVLFTATTKAIDSSKINEVFGHQISNNIIDVSFRFCMPGEIIRDNHCVGCSAGTYGLEWNATQCESCLENAICDGEDEISVRSGYWRRTTNSTKIIECLNEDACEGGYHPENENPVQCASGYEGNLCTKCQVTDEFKYQKVSDYMCEKCPDPIMNAIRVIGVALIVFLFFMIIMIINIRKKKESEMSILLRIFTNYLQLLSSSLSFQVSYPNALLDVFYPVDRVGSSSDTFLSFDCFATDIEITGPFPSNAFLKLFLTALLPIILFLIVAVIWIICRLISKKIVPDMKRSLAISFISSLFLLHPTLARHSLSIFQCVDIDDGVSKVRIDTDMDCYSSEHLGWCFLIGFPILIIWVIAAPIFGLILLSKNIGKDDDNKVKQYMLILYQGFRRRVFYWEFVNSLRKVLILMMFALLITSKPLYRLMASLAILVVAFRLQLYLKPYRDEKNNEIEILALLAGTLTLFSGLVFSEDDQQPLLNFIILIFVMIINVKFILQWTYLFALCMSERYKICKKLLVIMSILTCRQNQNEGPRAHPREHKKLNKKKLKKKRLLKPKLGNRKDKMHLKNTKKIYSTPMKKLNNNPSPAILEDKDESSKEEYSQKSQLRDSNDNFHYLEKLQKLYNRESMQKSHDDSVSLSRSKNEPEMASSNRILELRNKITSSRMLDSIGSKEVDEFKIFKRNLKKDHHDSK